jgi:hypothetical protein
MPRLIGAAAPAGQPAPLPAEIPMHKAKKALVIMGREDDVLEAINSIENEISRRCILHEYNSAPNLVLDGASTQLIMGLIGMDEAEKTALAELALSLP